MKTYPKPKVILNCVASHYATPKERIIEYSNGPSGGLIQLYTDNDGTLRVVLYSHDKDVKITVGIPRK